jgi:hypothetical protein
MNRTLLRPIRSALILAILFGFAGLPASADFLGLSRLFKDWGLFQGLQITGSNDFTFQQNFVEGSGAAYENQRWDTDPFQRRTTLSLEGPIWKEFGFKADLSYSGYGQSYTRWVTGYVGHDTALYYGDLNIDLSGNQFCTFSKPVQGYQLDQRIGKGLARVFYSKEKAITRYQTVTGNNTSGPFFLTYTPVMQGTEVVKVNEQVQEFGKDYRLDYDTGQLWFEVEGRPPKIIPDTATITVSYQSAGYDSSTGTLYGGRVLMPFMDDRLQVGFTMLQQDRDVGGSRDNVGYQEDIFNGSGSTGPFDVNFRPIIANGTTVIYRGEEKVIEQALLVLVDNVEQAEGVDYDSYRQIGRVIFRRSVPPTALVIIRYFYDLSTTLPATNNSLMGVDLLYHLNPQLSVQAEWGRSDGGLVTNTGDALRVNLNYSGQRFKAMAEYRDIKPTFAFLDSVGFYRQDRGYDVGVNWQPLDHVSLFLRRSDLQTSQGYSFGYSPYGGYGGNYSGLQLQSAGGVYPRDTAPPSLSIGSQRNEYELRLDFPHWPTFAFQRQEMTNSGGTGGDSSYGANNLSLNWSPAGKPYSVSANLSNTDQSYSSPTDASAFRGSQTQQFQWSASYRPSEKLGLSYNQGRNQSRAVGADDRSSSSTDQFSLHWTPFRKLDLNYDFTMTSSVGSVGSGFYNTPGNDYGGGIGGGGGGIFVPPGGTVGDTSTRYSDNTSRLGVRFSATDRLNFDYSWTQRKYSSGGSVGYLADSNQDTQSLGVSYMLSQAISLNAQYNMDRMVFLDEGRGAVSNNTLGFGANWQPQGSPWGFGLYYNAITGSSPTYLGFGSNQRMRIVDNNMSDLRAQVTYALSQETRLSLTGQLSDYAGGYANFNRQQLELGIEHSLSSYARLQFGYRFMRNLTNGLDDPRFGNTSLTPQNQNYLANTLLLTFTTQFNTGIGGRSSGISGFGGSSLGGFTGYRAGTGLGTPGGTGSYGTSGPGYSGFNQLGVFNNPSTGAGYQSPFGATPFGSSGTYGSPGMGNYGTYNTGQPQGYETFGGNFRGSTGGLGSGLGDISGGRKPGAGDVVPAPPPGTAAPGATEQLPDIQDWQTLDDMYSIWW